MARRRSTRAPSTRPGSASAVERRAGREQAPGERRAAADCRSRPARSPSRVRISSRSLPAHSAGSKPPSAGPARPMLSTSGRRQPLDLEAPGGVGARASERQGGRRLGAGGPASSVSRLGEQLDRPALGGERRGREQERMRRQQRRDAMLQSPGRSVAGAHRQAASARKLVVRAGPVRPARSAAGFPRSRETRLPPSTTTSTTANRTRLIVDMVPSDYIHRIRAKRLPRARIAALYRVHEPVSTPGQTSRRRAALVPLMGDAIDPEPLPVWTSIARSCWSA